MHLDVVFRRDFLGPISFVIKRLEVAMPVSQRFQSETHWKWLLERPRSGRYMGVGYCNKTYLRSRLGFIVRKLREEVSPNTDTSLLSRFLDKTSHGAITHVAF